MVEKHPPFLILSLHLIPFSSPPSISAFYMTSSLPPSLLPSSSSIVQKALIDAHNAGMDIRVIVVDSRPKMEGW